MDPKNEFKNPHLYFFVPENHPLMQSAKVAASVHSLTPAYPIGIVVATHDKVLCEAGNGNGYHESHKNMDGHIEGCVRRFISQERVKNGGEKIKPGEEFDLCPGCHTDFHAESNVIRKANDLGVDMKDVDIYMYGHYWCCGDCWDKMKKIGVGKVILPDTYKKFEDIEEVKKWAKECKEMREFLINKEV